MRKESALVALLVASIFYSSSVYALDSIVGFGSEALFLYPICKGGEAPVNAPGFRAASRLSGAFLVGPHLYWRVSDDFALTFGGYLCSKPLNYVSNFSLSEFMNSTDGEAFMNQFERGFEFKYETSDFAIRTWPAPEREGARDAMTQSPKQGLPFSEIDSSFDYGALRTRVNTAISGEVEPVLSVLLGSEHADYASLLKQLGLEEESVRGADESKVKQMIWEVSREKLESAYSRSDPICSTVGCSGQPLSVCNIKFNMSLRQHIPIVAGAEYNLYSSDIFSIGIFGSVGLGVWTARVKLIAEPVKARLLFDSEESSYTLVGFGGLKFGLRLGSATVALSGGYGYFGQPEFKWSEETGPFLPRLNCAVYGPVASAEIGFQF